jgi:chorismate mutase/prephenate dehydrogenase
MTGLRKEIDKTDRAILKLLSKRMKLVRKIGKIKRKYGMRIVDRKREKEILSRLEVDAKKFNLPESQKYLHENNKRIKKE